MQDSDIKTFLKSWGFFGEILNPQDPIVDLYLESFPKSEQLIVFGEFNREIVNFIIYQLIEREKIKKQAKALTTYHLVEDIYLLDHELIVIFEIGTLSSYPHKISIAYNQLFNILNREIPLIITTSSEEWLNKLPLPIANLLKGTFTFIGDE